MRLPPTGTDVSVVAVGVRRCDPGRFRRRPRRLLGRGPLDRSDARILFCWILATALGIEGRVPDSYLLYSQASLVQRADARVGGAARYVAVLRTSLDRLAKGATQQEKASTLKAVSDLIDTL